MSSYLMTMLTNYIAVSVIALYRLKADFKCCKSAFYIFKKRGRFIMSIEEIWKDAVESLAPLTERIPILDTEIVSLNSPATVEPESLTFKVEGTDLAVYLATVKHKEQLEAYLTKRHGGIPCILVS